MGKSGIARWILIATLLAAVLGLGVPAHSAPVLFDHSATGSGTDGVGNQLQIHAYDSFLLGGLGVATVRLANTSGRASTVILDCVIFDARPGPGFHFVYTSGHTLAGQAWYIGVFDDFGVNRTGPYDVMYTHTTPVNGPCNVAAVSSYPIGWFPVSTGDFVVN